MDIFMKDNLYFISTYGMKYKRQINKEHFEINDKHRVFKGEIIKEVICKKQLTKKIKALPKGLQVKIYIFAMKEFNKEYVPPNGEIPIYHNHLNYVTNELGKTFINNIHFLHLDFNTLPENKRWIMGCQCSYCKSQDICKEEEYEKYKSSSTYFLKHIKCTNGPLNFWNYLYEYFVDEYDDILTYTRVFDPLYSSREIEKSKTQTKYLSFCEETCEKYKYIPPKKKFKFV